MSEERIVRRSLRDPNRPKGRIDANARAPDEEEYSAEFWADAVVVHPGQRRESVVLERAVIERFQKLAGERGHRELMADVLREYVAKRTADDDAPPAEAAE